MTTTNNLTLKDYGWGAHFQAQLSDEDMAALPVRVMAVHRDILEVAGPDFEGRVQPLFGGDETTVATVGDW
ncbi:MAG: ribosome small subunit-dependent GTPase A, partial [Alphaproteobacteria bacterium]|nr:ribosome small subunit-dependent GTPase A [Alphaproteobacteria bacterium]